MSSIGFDRLEENIKTTKYKRKLHEAIEFAEAVWKHSNQFYGAGIELLEWLNLDRDNPMGYVFKAEKHLGGERKLVCVKIINVEKIHKVDKEKRDYYESIRRDLHPGGDPIQVFFERELGALKRTSVKHNPNIIVIDDIVTKYEDFKGEMADFPYYVMEFIDGMDLNRMLNERRMFELLIAINYIMQVCNALKDIHGEGYIYQDLSPSNIMITGDHKLVKLIDFGTLREYSEDTATFYGKTGYKAPETSESHMKIAFTMDIFPLGVIFYECLVGLGKQPYSNPDQFILPYARYKNAPSDLERSVIRQDYERKWKDVVSQSKRAEDIIPPNVFDIILKCVAIDPADRYKNGDSSGVPLLLEDLRKLYGIKVGTSSTADKLGEFNSQVFNGDSKTNLRLQKSLETQALNKPWNRIDVFARDYPILSLTFSFDGAGKNIFPLLKFYIDAKKADQTSIEDVPDEAARFEIIYQSGKKESFDLGSCLPTSEGLQIPGLSGYVIALNYDEEFKLKEVDGDRCVILSDEGIDTAKIAVYSGELKRNGEVVKFWEGCMGTHVRMNFQKYQEAVKARIKSEDWDVVRRKFYEAYEESGRINEYALLQYRKATIKMIENLIENENALSEAYNLHNEVKSLHTLWKPEHVQLELLLRLGTMYIQEEKYHDALEIFKEFDELFSDSGDGSIDKILPLTVKNNVAVCLVKQWESTHDSDMLRDARAILKEQLDVQEVTGYVASVLYTNLATACCYSGNMEEAKAWCEKAIESDSSYVESYSTMSIIHESEGNEELAVIFKEISSNLSKDFVNIKLP